MVRRVITKISTDNKCGRGCGEKGILLYCWEGKLVQLLWKTVWRFPQKPENRTSPAIAFLGICLKKTLILKDTCTSMFTVAHTHIHTNGILRSVQFSRSVMSDSLRPHESQHTRPPCLSPTPRVHSDSGPLSR